MFITRKRHGYYRSQQVASGLFLILVQPKWDSLKYPHNIDQCSTCGKPRAEHDTTTPWPICSDHGVLARLRARAADQPEPVPDLAGCAVCQAREQMKIAAGCVNFISTSFSYPIKALVRFVSMSQVGQFMSGRARVSRETVILSGSYGSDGLLCDVSDSVYDRAVLVPPALVQAWKNGGGWNSAGNEAEAMKTWALANLKHLRA